MKSFSSHLMQFSCLPPAATGLFAIAAKYINGSKRSMANDGEADNEQSTKSDLDFEKECERQHRNINNTV